MTLPKQVTIKEVGPRDGLQNESFFLPTDKKIEWINQLSNSGLKYIEVTSFVHPKWIPQLKDAKEVVQSIERKDDVTYAALVPNMKGLENALEANIDEVSVFMSASETHNKKNINKSIEETYPVLKEVIDEAKNAHKSVRGYVSTVFGCPYEGQIDEDQVIDVCMRLFDMGIDELSLGDTTGVANPLQVEQFLTKVQKYFPKEKLALHFHDTRGLALANIAVALKLEFSTFDSSLGGLGGCPYAKGATGNVATDDLVHMLHEMNIDTGIQLNSLLKAGELIQTEIGKALTSKQMAIYSKS